MCHASCASVPQQHSWASLEHFKCVCQNMCAANTQVNASKTVEDSRLQSEGQTWHITTCMCFEWSNLSKVSSERTNPPLHVATSIPKGHVTSHLCTCDDVISDITTSQHHVMSQLIIMTQEFGNMHQMQHIIDAFIRKITKNLTKITHVSTRLAYQT